MREILGRRRTTRSTLHDAAITCATRWQWPVVPGATCTPGPGPDRQEEPVVRSGARPGSSSAPVCSCADPDCVVPGAHPDDPVLLAATTDPRMVSWWWTGRPDASLILATGAASDGAGRAPCALSLPAIAGRRALAVFRRSGVRVGPVVASPTRFALLVAPYELEELGDLLYAHDWVPSSLRFHGEGGYVALPPSQGAGAPQRWEREPEVERGGGAPWLPRMNTLLDGLVEASAAVPDPGSRLAY
ncbi:bifunctional DNA primase/polymerase [Streptomyces sp. N2-109]|uniref:Bifunctional DNA primase/polymerase n=1 Tax=Streptomyces gossypii TaxID=2883101 RepID=A0ABT2JNA2_9ACTN|nr:bifunctional DNA primase/polymerase [Streptomyces gossypii]MCT2589350.1 bifunctional DNA primase/polymerase [Streptomyces gossypii]